METLDAELPPEQQPEERRHPYEITPRTATTA
jgi:hypothetical protein